MNTDYSCITLYFKWNRVFNMPTRNEENLLGRFFLKLDYVLEMQIYCYKNNLTLIR